MGPWLNSITYSEIMSQAAVWREILDSYPAQAERLGERMADLRRREGGPRIVVTGCGTAYALGLTVASVLRHYEIPAFALPASEVAFYSDQLVDRPSALLAISRSGMSSEVLWASEAFCRVFPRQTLITLTTQPESTLANDADIILDASSAQERAVPETRSFTSMLLLAHAFAASLGGDAECLDRLGSLPAALDSVMPAFVEVADQISSHWAVSRYFFLGAGPLYGIALEGMFKIKEYTGGWAEAFYPLEFRHGPRAAANSEAVVVGLLSDRQAGAELRLLREMKGQGAKTMAVFEQRMEIDLAGVDLAIELPGGLNEWERGALVAPLLQLMGFCMAQQAGLDPDHPAGLRAVTQL